MAQNNKSHLIYIVHYLYDIHVHIHLYIYAFMHELICIYIYTYLYVRVGWMFPIHSLVNPRWQKGRIFLGKPYVWWVCIQKIKVKLLLPVLYDPCEGYIVFYALLLFFMVCYSFLWFVVDLYVYILVLNIFVYLIVRFF